MRGRVFSFVKISLDNTLSVEEPNGSFTRCSPGQGSDQQGSSASLFLWEGYQEDLCDGAWEEDGVWGRGDIEFEEYKLIVREFFIKDKKTGVAYRGYEPSTDINCPPFDYFRFGYANHLAHLFQDNLKVKCPVPIPDALVRKFALQQTDEMIAEKLSNSEPNAAIHTLLFIDTLSHKEQEKLLKGVTLTPSDFLWMNREAQDVGYLLDVYHEE